MTDTLAKPEAQTAVAEAPKTSSTAPAIKTRLPYQRACNEKDAKGKLCSGHLKRWYGFGDNIKSTHGLNAEIYRCEHCHTVYLPTPGFDPRTGTLQF